MQDLKQHIAHSIFWNYATAFGSQFVSLLGSILLTSLLTPDDFGVMAFAMIVLGVWGLFIGQGYAQAIVQSKEVSNIALNTIFWINLAVGLGTLSISYFVGNFLSSFFEIDHFGWYLFLFSISSTIDSFNVVQLSILQRNLKFKQIGIALLVANAISISLAIVMAIMGYGIYSLIAKSIVLSAVYCILIWCYTKWIPTFSFNKDSLLSHKNFSRSVFLNHVLQYSSNKYDRLVITKLLGTSDLGIYNRANTFTVNIANDIKSRTGQVAFAALSKLKKGSEYNEYMFNMVLFFNTLIAPVILIVLLSSQELITLYLSADWHDLIPIIQLIGLFTLLLISGMPVRILMSLGEGEILLKTSITTAILKVLILSIAFVLSPDLITMIVIVIISKLVDVLVKNYAAHKHIRSKFNEVFKFQIAPAIITMAAFLLAYLVDDYWTAGLLYKAIIKAFVGVAIFSLLYIYVYKDFLSKAIELVLNQRQ